MRLFGRIVLRTLGALVMLAAVIAALGMLSVRDEAKTAFDAYGVPLFGFTVFVSLPFGLAHLFFITADDLYDRQQPHFPGRPTRLLKLELGLALFFLLALAACLPVPGRAALLVALLLVFARVHRGWATHRFRTPVGWTSYGQVFDFVVGGTVYLFTFVLVTLLTGGRVLTGFNPSGGSFGGGGSSGKW